MDCRKCGRRIRPRQATRSAPYHYTGCGLDSVFLSGIIVYRCTGCRAESPKSPKLQQLHNVIARELLKLPGTLTGGQLRFLRKNAGFSSVQFAQLLGITRFHLSKVENRKVSHLGGTAEILARLVVTSVLNDGKVARDSFIGMAESVMQGTASRASTHSRFALVHDKWRTAA